MKEREEEARYEMKHEQSKNIMKSMSAQ